MAVTRAEKETELGALQSAFKGSESAVIVDYKGLNVPQVTDLRRQLRLVKASYKVVKNTLARRAVQGTEFECLREKLKGPLVLAFSRRDPGAAARVIKSFAKEHEKLVTVAVALGGALYSPRDIDRVASLPTLEQARAKLLGTLIAPAAQLVRVLAEPGAMLARTLKARGEKAA